jgi:hypothetical protein
MVNLVNKKILATMALTLLIMTTVSQVFLSQTSVSTVHGSSEGSIDTNAEYSNGTLGTPYPGISLWYSWINTSGSQVIFLAYQSYGYSPPVITFLGQHYYSENGTEVFVGNTLGAMEIYNDTNGNGLPDVNYTSGQSEILYDFFVNSSAGSEIKPINRTVIGGLPHYQWGIHYQTVDGFLESTEGPFAEASVMVDYMDFSYDFYVQNNVTYLKTNFGLGRILQVTPIGGHNVSLSGLSLALLYGTAVITSKPYVTMVNGIPYNSTTASASVEPTDSSVIRIAQATAYKFLFGQNYTLFRDSTPEIHESKCTAVPDQSVSEAVRRNEWILTSFEDTLTSIFPNIGNTQGAINLDYNVSSFLYRVCYPVWSGYQLQHDPTYVAYLGTPIVSELSPPLMFVIAAATASTIVLVAALIDLKKTSKTLKHLKPSMTFPV